MLVIIILFFPTIIVKSNLILIINQNKSIKNLILIYNYILR
jgi:nitrogen fixation protein FixH